MEFKIALTEAEKTIMAEAMLSEKDLSDTLREATQEDNEDALVSPQAQAQIDSLNGYLDAVRGAVIAPLKAAQGEIERMIENAEDLCDRASDMINKAQRSTSQRIQLLNGIRGKR
jgi:ATP-dependent Zn protease